MYLGLRGMIFGELLEYSVDGSMRAVEVQKGVTSREWMWW